jgi:hypothetical protein
MAWYNPATWTVVDNLQGQNNKRVAGGGGGGGGWGSSAPSGNMPTWGTGVKQPAPTPTPTNYAASSYRPPARAANFDVAGTWAQAYNQAAAEVNPLYDKLLNQFLQAQAVQKKSQEDQYGRTVEAADMELRNTLEGNTLNRDRTAADTTMAIEGINTKQDEFQTDAGQQFEQDRMDLSTKNAQSGLSGGLGAQKIEKLGAASNTMETRAGADADIQKKQAEIMKVRTFEDLGRSDKITGEKTGLTKKSAKFDLDNWIEAAAIAADKERTQNSIDRQGHQKIAAEAIASRSYANFLASIANPEVAIATANKYGASF